MVDARVILNGRKVLFLGDSILRNLYQDLVYLLEKGREGSMLPQGGSMSGLPTFLSRGDTTQWAVRGG